MKGYEKVKELVQGELDNYSYWKDIEIDIDDAYNKTEEDEYYKVKVKDLRDKVKYLCFHYIVKEDKLEIELGEDNFEEVEDYSYKIKYFWMALLEW